MSKKIGVKLIKKSEYFENWENSQSSQISQCSQNSLSALSAHSTHKKKELSHCCGSPFFNNLKTIFANLFLAYYFNEFTILLHQVDTFCGLSYLQTLEIVPFDTVVAVSVKRLDACRIVFSTGLCSGILGIHING